jgi:hypothetical protein
MYEVSSNLMALDSHLRFTILDVNSTTIYPSLTMHFIASRVVR